MQTRGLGKIAVTGAAVVLLVIPGLADYHYASHTGTSTPPYTSWATAADSIQKAIDASSPHDTVYISAGQWYETVATGVYDSVAIIGAGIDSTYWYGDSAFTPILMIDYNCSVEKITFQHTNGYYCIFGNVFAPIKIKTCRFIKSQSGLHTNGGPTEISNCIFDSCRSGIVIPLWYGDYFIHNNLFNNIYEYEAIYLQVHSAIIENNIIINLAGTDVSSIASGILDSTVRIRNNIIVNGGWGVAAYVVEGVNNSISKVSGAFIGTVDSIINNSISDCAIGVQPDPTTVVRYSNFWSNVMDFNGTPLDTLNLTKWNPMYNSETDFHLQAYSPLIDSGDPDILDIDSTRSDIGAYGGSSGSSYTYQDLPPKTPDSLHGIYSQDTIRLWWTYNTEGDFNRYLLYRDTVGGFAPSTLNLIAQPESSVYIDLDVSNLHDYYYRIAAVDNQDNVSGYSPELIVITSGIWNQSGPELPQLTAISRNYPNPFNNSTMIVYRVANLGPMPAQIKIDIYDAVGRKVRTLVNERKEAGEHRINWDGRDDLGGQLSSGVYFAKISQWGLELSGRPRKLTLIK
jgi:hypothetical protein